MPRLTAALIAVLLLSGGSYAARALAGSDAEADSATAGPALVRSNVSPRLDELHRLITVFEGRISDHTDSLDYRTLAGFHFDRARLTGDIDDYRRAVSLLEDALRLSPGQADAERRLAAALVATHRFDRALDLTRSRLAADPLDADALLVATDAHLEIGNVSAAAAAVEHVSLIAPGDPAVLVRRAEIAHLAGNQRQAIEYAARALATAQERGLDGRSLAFYSLFQADLELDAGNSAAALRLAERAVGLDAGWAEAHASLAGIRASRGEHEAAVDLYTTALDLRPDDPEWLAARADLLTVTGDPEAAATDLARAVEILAAEDPVVYGRSLSRLYSDHRLRPEEALRLAEEDLARRQDVLGYDTYAWALYRNGRHAEAAEAITPVAASGIQDVHARFHVGIIAAAVGDAATALAHLRWVLETHPNFDPLLVDDARRALDEVS